MKTRWQVALAGFLTGIGMAGAAWAHGDVVPHAVDTTGLTPLGEDLQGEDPYRDTPDYKLAQEIGAKGFNQNCARCHGLGAVSGGIAPDLRQLVPVDERSGHRPLLVTRCPFVEMPPTRRQCSLHARPAASCPTCAIPVLERDRGSVRRGS